MKRINKISIEDFWTLYSKESIQYMRNSELPQNLDFNVFFNGYFGNLTQHNFFSSDGKKILIQCKKCQHQLNPSQSICEAHTGIIRGQFERLFKKRIKLIHSLVKDICIIESI